MAGASRIWKFVETKFAQGKNITWTCWGLRSIFYDFSQQASGFVWSTAVCSPTFRRDLLLLLLNPYHTFSAITAL